MIDQSSFALSREDISVMKGLAIIAMICHHLNPSEFHIQNIPWYWNIISSVGKVCVAMFVFCSGYGLSAQYVKLLDRDNEIGGGRIKSTILFLLRRFVKFYANYWPIFLVFVPISVCLFNRPLEVPYVAGHIPMKLFLDFLGIQGEFSYNITWWFNRLIIILYLLFPLLCYLGRRVPLLLFAISFFLSMFAWEIGGGYTWTGQILLYSFPFSLGLLWARYYDRMDNFQIVLKRFKIIANLLCLVFIFICIYLRQHLPYAYAIKLDGLLTLSIAFLIVATRRYANFSRKVFSYFGKHSANMYLVHTFINAYWSTAFWLHSQTSGILKFFLLFGASLILSLLIEYLKKISKFIDLTNMLIAKISLS